MKMDSEAAKESELAISLAQSQRDNNPIYLWAHFNASMANYRLGNLKKAEELALKSYRMSGNHLDSFYMLSVIAAEKNDWQNVFFFSDKYLSLLHQYKADSSKANINVNNTLQEENLIYSLLGHAYYFINNREQMNNYYGKAFDCSDDKRIISLKIGSFHLDRTEDYQLAKYYIDKTLEHSHDDLEAMYVLAKYYKKTGSPTDEKQSLEWLFSKGSKDTVVLNRLIDLCLEFDDLDLATKVTEDAIEDADAKDCYLLKKAEIHRRKDEPASAIECYMKILEQNPGSGYVWYELGNVFHDMGELQNAEAFFKKAASLMNDPTLPLLKLCEIYIINNSLDDIINILSSLINMLGIHLSTTINNMNELLSVFNKISFTLKEDSEYSYNFTKLIGLFKIKYAHLLSGKQSNV